MFENFAAAIAEKHNRYYGDGVLSVKQKFQQANTVFNVYPSHVEILAYRRDFIVRRRGIEANEKTVARCRLMRVREDGVLVPVDVSKFNVSRLMESLAKSRKRALDSIYAYALANRWDYFATFTIDQTKVDRMDDNAVIAAWSDFERMMVARFRHCKILCVPEYHPTSGALHFHALIANADLKPYLTPKYYVDCEKNRKAGRVGKRVYSKCGDPCSELTIYDYGWSDIFPLPGGGNKLRVANYLSKYLSKEMAMDYNRKSYYRTRNLEQRGKITTYMDERELHELLASYGTTETGQYDMLQASGYEVRVKKDTEKMRVFEIWRKMAGDTNASQNTSFAKKYMSIILN